MSLLFNTLSRFVIVFLPRSKCLLTSWLQWLSAVILKPPPTAPKKSVSASTFSPSICHEVMGLDAMIWIFWMMSLRLVFSLFYFTLIKKLFGSSSLSAIRLISSAYLRLLILRESVPRQVDRESRGPQGERGLEFSRRKKGQTFLSFSTFLRII